MRLSLRNPLIISRWLIVIGSLVILAVIVTGLVDVSQASNPFDQALGSSQSGQGFAPIMVPQAGLPQGMGAPTLPSETTGLNESIQTTPTKPVVSPTATGTPAPTWNPDRIVIPAIKLDAPVKPAKVAEIVVQGTTFREWVAPNSFAVGELGTSASLGTYGNTVLIGHHNVYGEVFGHLVDLHVGDLILLYSGDKEFAYTISVKKILPERWQSVEVRLENAQWIAPSQDERLTLVTCWPYESNTHRLIIVATPINLDTISDYEIIPRLTPHPTPN